MDEIAEAYFIRRLHTSLGYELEIGSEMLSKCILS